jgi:hypothetical protein
MMQLQKFHQSQLGATPKWFNSPISTFKGDLSGIGKFLPEFERRSFGLTQPGMDSSSLNERLDMIVRKPTAQDPNFVPIGIVSKEYALIPHAEVHKTAFQAIKALNISPTEVKAELQLSEYGERMALSLYLPEKFSFDPGDHHPLSLRFECFNSVEGSTRFRALMGWFRLVCSNGLIVGITNSDIRFRHSGDVQMESIGEVLKEGLKRSEEDKLNFINWQKCEIQSDQITKWVEKTLQKEWGFKAAARTFHISKTGHDVEILGPYKDNTPFTVPVKPAKKVPGAPGKSRNLYDVSQILAWLAKERRDLQEQLEWREKIPKLMNPLLH